MRKLTTKRILKWSEANLKSEEEKMRELIIHEKLERKYRGIKYFLYDLENAGGSRWISLEADFNQFQGWEHNLIVALQYDFDLTGSFLCGHSRNYRDGHEPILYQIDFLDGIAEEQIDFLYSLCTKGSESVNKKIEYFNQVLKWMEKFNVKERK